MKHSQISDKILKSFYNVYNSLGYGFLEKVYERAMLNELKQNNLSAISQYPIKIFYYDKIVGEYFADIIVENKIIIELKTGNEIYPQHECQLLNYLNASNFEVGLLLNFGLKPDKKRKVYDNNRKIYLQKNDIPNTMLNTDKIDIVLNSFHKVYRYFGFGFQEMVYRNAMEIELQKTTIDFKRNFPLSIYHDGIKVGEFCSEFCFKDLIIKIISQKQITVQDEKTMVNILKGTNTETGLILNFGYKPEVKRKFKNKQKLNRPQIIAGENGQ